MKKLLFILCAAGLLNQACGSKDKKPDPVEPPIIILPSPTPVVSEPPVVKGHIEYLGDFSPQCPAIPGYVPPAKNSACEMGYRVCSGGINYTCVANQP